MGSLMVCFLGSDESVFTEKHSPRNRGCEDISNIDIEGFL